MQQPRSNRFFRRILKDKLEILLGYGFLDSVLIRSRKWLSDLARGLVEELSTSFCTCQGAKMYGDEKNHKTLPSFFIWGYTESLKNSSAEWTTPSEFFWEDFSGEKEWWSRKFDLNSILSSSIRIHQELRKCSEHGCSLWRGLMFQ